MRQGVDGSQQRCLGISRAAPRNKGMQYPPDPPRAEEIVLVMREAGHDRHGLRVRALIAVLWRAGLRISEALALNETDIDERRGSLLIRHGKGDRRREAGMDQFGFEQLAAWLAHRVSLPPGPLFCDIDGPTRGRRWSATAARAELRALAVDAGVRRRFAPHQYADLIVMPTRPGEVLQSVNSAVRNIGIFLLHFEGPLGGRCGAAETVSRDWLDVWVGARDAVNRMRGSAFAAWPSIGLRDAPLVRVSPLRPTSRARRDRERRRVMPTPTPRSTQTAGTPSPASA